MLMGSIAIQIRWLQFNLETHIQANHLFENLAALACVGSIFDGAEAAELLTAVQPMLEREIWRNRFWKMVATTNDRQCTTCGCCGWSRCLSRLERPRFARW